MISPEHRDRVGKHMRKTLRDVIAKHMSKSKYPSPKRYEQADELIRELIQTGFLSSILNDEAAE